MAEGWFEVAGERAPSDPDVLVEGAALRERFGDEAAAEGLYARAADLRPDLVVAWLGLARMGLERRDLGAAEAALRRAGAAVGGPRVVVAAEEGAREPGSGRLARLVAAMARGLAGDREGALAALAEAGGGPDALVEAVRGFVLRLPEGAAPGP